ncbi:MAG: pentapeptide repeat-containing protein [Planctomycetota bacterium]|jgi:hypothetical protein
MADADNESNLKQQRGEPAYKQEHYDFLKECSNKMTMFKWNDWREEHPDETVALTGAHLERVFLREANLQGAYLFDAHLEGADLREANLQNAYLRNARLQDANLEGAKLQNAKLWEANLQRANLRESCLQDAEFMRARLQGAEFGGAKLQGADFSRAIVDGETLIWNCEFNERTKFEGVALGNMRIYPQEKQAFEYNIRRMNWEAWYEWKDWYRRLPEKKRSKASRALRSVIRLFWAISDYGRSTGRIIGWFFGLAVAFAFVYWKWPSLIVLDDWFTELRGFVHALYFSVVTMTTLGFGDIAANPDNWVGQVVLMVQVILGYVLLGALVTRFAVLFAAGGPAGEFVESKPKETAEGERDKKPQDEQAE